MNFQTPEHTGNIALNIVSSALICIAWIFNYVSEYILLQAPHISMASISVFELLSVNFYDIIFKSLSIISVSMVIVINWEKFKQKLPLKKKSHAKKRRNNP